MNRKFLLSSAVVFALIAGCASSPESSTEPEKTEKKYRYEDPAPETKVEAPKKKDIYALVNCTNGIENRTLSIAVDETGCKLMYEKGEKIDVVAESANGNEHCMKAREKIRKRLVGAGWKCIQ